MAKVSWYKGQALAQRDQARLQRSYRNLLTASLSLITFFFFPLVLQTPELSILKSDCLIDYVSFQPCTVIVAFLKVEIILCKGIAEVYQAGNFRDKWFQF